MVNIHMGAQPLADFARVRVKPPVNLRPRRLHGREGMLSELGAGDPQPLQGEITVIHGLGGIGKTALALTVAGAAHGKGASVWWIRASEVEGVHAALRQIAVQLAGSDADARHVAAGTLNAVDMAWEALHQAEEPWLLVFDGADDPGAIEEALGEGWLEASAAGAVLVTTRQGSADMWPEACRMVKLGPLDPSSGAELLLDLAGQPESERDAAHALSERLRGVPLALRLAGRCVSQPLSPVRSLSAFHQALDRDFAGFVDRAAHASLRPGGDDQARQLVMETWEVSLDALEQQGIAHVRSVLRVLGCWAAHPVPVGLLSPKVLQRTHGTGGAPWDALAVERALRALHAAGLIDIVDESPVVRPVEDDAFYQWAESAGAQECIVVHPLVAEVNAAQLANSPSRRPTWAAAVRCLGALRGMWGTGASVGYWQFVIPHLASVASRLPDTYDDLFEVAVETQMYLSKYLRFSGQYEAGYRSAMLLHERLDSFRVRDLIRFLVMYDCGEWSWHMSRLDEAGALTSEACRLAESTPGIDEFLSLMSRELAVAIHAERGFLDVGERMARELCDELEGKPRFVQLSLQAHHHLATILRESGRLAEAETHSRKAVDFTDTVDVAPFSRAVIWHELGVILWHRGHLDQARRLLTNVLALQRKSLPPWHPSLLVTRYDLASIHGIQGHKIRAYFEFMDIQLIEEDILGKCHRNTLQTRHQVGQILVELKELDQAEVVLRGVEEGYRSEGLLNRSADVMSTRHERVHIKAQRGRTAEAHREWRHILAEEQRDLGAEHPSTLRTHFNWAVCWAAMGLPGPACREMRKVLAARRRVLGADHYETREAVRTLADLARLPPQGWRFGGTGRVTEPYNREGRRRSAD